jgi:hypothetical protein
MEIGPICTNFVSNRLDATRHTQNTTLSTKSERLTFLEEDIKSLVFRVVSNYTLPPLLNTLGDEEAATGLQRYEFLSK